jgi:hypothetical protein
MGLKQCAIYVCDYASPTGIRLAMRRLETPQAVSGRAAAHAGGGLAQQRRAREERQATNSQARLGQSRLHACATAFGGRAIPLT